MTAWTKLTSPKNGKGASWRHTSGWELHHCGHPTAIWPYWLRDPDPAHAGDITMSHNGLGFSSVAAAKLVIEGLAAGELTTTADRCAPGVRRIPGANADGRRRREPDPVMEFYRRRADASDLMVGLGSAGHTPRLA